MRPALSLCIVVGPQWQLPSQARPIRNPDSRAILGCFGSRPIAHFQIMSGGEFPKTTPILPAQKRPDSLGIYAKIL
jgi:hypothetical protein